MSKVSALAADIAALEVHGRQLQEIIHDRSTWWHDAHSHELFPTDERRARVQLKLDKVNVELGKCRAADLGNLDGDLELHLAAMVMHVFDLGAALGLDIGSSMSELLTRAAGRR